MNTAPFFINYTAPTVVDPPAIILNKDGTCKQEFERRMNICMSCEFKLTEDLLKCSKCMCPISNLLSFNSKSCPIGKW
ncbi:hypothetical protein EB118_25890 [bacterium]|nr:hypothetical protein [bacterium]NDD84661.1 hypothetical protein [bacterium]NDG33473.1 hypothetical protein [bacterium]